MKIPKRFRDAIENEPADLPDYVWLEYAVCALGPAPCGWAGWIIGAAFKRTTEHHATSTGDKALVSDHTQVCPHCRGPEGRDATLFRTGHHRRLEVSPDQTPPLVEGRDYVRADDIEYE
jgi:hypothetical protein